MSTTYTFPVRFNGDPLAGSGLSPSFIVFKDAATGINITPETVEEIGGGHYRFIVNWSDSKYDGVDSIVTVIDNTAVITSPLERYISGNISRYDNFTEIIQDNNDKLITIATDVSDILAVETGKWEIVDHKLKFYDQAGFLIRSFNLYDSNGLPTSTSPFSRVPIS